MTGAKSFMIEKSAPMGDAEVQTLQATTPASAALARQNCEIHAGIVRPLVSSLRKRLNAGSRMS